MATQAETKTPPAKPRFLVCPPRFYDTHYLFNPWMGYRERVDKGLAWRQWRDLVRALEQAGAQVETIEPAPDSSAMVFTADAALVIDTKSVLLLPNDGSRGVVEPPLFREWFRANAYATESLPSQGRLDGGNLVPLHDGSIAVGIKPGATGRSEAYLRKRLALTSPTRSLFEVALIDRRFLHLDTVLANAAGRAYLLFEEGLAAGAAGLTGSPVMQKEVIHLGQSDAEAFAANLVSIGTTIITGKVSPALRRRLSGLGLWVEELPLTEFYQAGGGAKCLTLPLCPATCVIAPSDSHTLPREAAAPRATSAAVGAIA